MALLTGLLMLACRPLLPVDETRYLSVAWEMWLRGDFLVPYKNGAVYVDKPPLLFWLMQGGWAVLGVSEWWPRLVPTLSAMTGVLLTARLAARLYPDRPEVARLASWMIATALLWQVFTGAVMFDMLLAVFSLLCLNALVAPPFGHGRWLWFALGLGAGLLTKGPVILLHTLPAALLAPWWGAAAHGPKKFAHEFSGQENPKSVLFGFLPVRGPADPGRGGTSPGRKTAWLIARCPGWGRWYGGLLGGMLGGLGIGLLWFLPAAREAGAAYGAAIGFHQTADRLLHNASHSRPWWWYLQLLPVLPLPWTFWPPLYRGLATLRRHGSDAGLRFCVAATLPALVIFCFISGKQAHYLLPLLAPAAVLAARGMAGLDEAPRRRNGWPLAMLLAVCGMLVLGLPQLSAYRPMPDWTQAIPVYAPLGLLLAAVAINWPQHVSRRRAIYVTGLVFALAFGAFYAGTMQALAPNFRLNEIARRIAVAQKAGAPVAHLGKYHAQFQFVGRLRQPLAVLHREELPAWIAVHPDGYVVATCDRWQPAPTGAYGQPYRGGALRLWPVAQLPAHPSEAQLCG